MATPTSQTHLRVQKLTPIVGTRYFSHTYPKKLRIPDLIQVYLCSSGFGNFWFPAVYEEKIRLLNYCRSFPELFSLIIFTSIKKFWYRTCCAWRIAYGVPACIVYGRVWKMWYKCVVMPPHRMYTYTVPCTVFVCCDSVSLLLYCRSQCITSYVIAFCNVWGVAVYKLYFSIVYLE